MNTYHTAFIASVAPDYDPRHIEGYIRIEHPTLDAANGWGTYDDFVRFVAEYHAACVKHPDATVSVSR